MSSGAESMWKKKFILIIELYHHHQCHWSHQQQGTASHIYILIMTRTRDYKSPDHVTF